MKYGTTLAFALAISALVLAFLFGAAVWPVVAGSAMAGASVPFVMMVRAGDRERRVRELVCAALGADADVVPASDLVRVLGTPDVQRARRDHLSREALVWAQRYANGDASDY